MGEWRQARGGGCHAATDRSASRRQAVGAGASAGEGAQSGGGVAGGASREGGGAGRLGAVADAANRQAAGCGDGARGAGGAGDQRRGRAADEDGGARRGAAPGAAGGTGGGRGSGGGAGGGAGAALPAPVGGVAAVHHVGHWLQRRYPSQRGIRPLAIGAVHTAGLLYRAGRRLPARGAAVDRRRLPETTSTATTLATSYVVTTVGTGLARGFMWSRGARESYFGPGPSKRVLARLVNAGVWAGAATAAYSAGVAYVGRANQKLEPGYATPPTSPLVSGSPDSLLPFADLGQQGRRYVTDVVTPELIEAVMGEPALAHPIRTYVGFNSEPLYQTGRAELALAELARTGAFDRSVLLLISPTGTGWIDQTLIEAAEFLIRGDIATCCIQYARYPSFLSVQKVALGRGQFRLLLWGVA